jgi:hypothetical protein
VIRNTQVERLVSQTCRWAAIASFLVAFVPPPPTNGQNPIPSKEYIRLGSRVIAIESPAVTVAVNAPGRSTIAYGEEETFTATVAGTSNTAVTWSIIPTTGAGSIGATTGIYAAPTTPQSSSIPVTITATSVAVPTLSASYVLTVNPAICVPMSSSPTSLHVSAAGISNFPVSVTQGGSWTVTPSDSSWIQIVSPVNGLGNGNETLTFNVLSNSGSARSGSIAMNTSIGMQSFSITQDASTATTTTVSPNPAHVLSTGGNVTINVTVTNGPRSTAWVWNNATPYPGTIDSVTCTCSTVSGTVTAHLTNNNAANSPPRTGYITVAGILVTINQDGNSQSVSVSPTNFSNVSGTGDTLLPYVTVTNGPLSSPWTTTSNSAWIHPSCTTTCSTGSAQLSLNVDANTDVTQTRTGTVTVASTATNQSIPITVTQGAGGLVVAPLVAFVTTSGTYQFNALVDGVPTSQGVTWSVNGSSSISSQGLLTAGSFPATVTVTATIGHVSANATAYISTATQAWVAPPSPINVASQEQVCSNDTCSTQYALGFKFASNQSPWLLADELYTGATWLITSNSGSPPSAAHSCQISFQAAGAYYLALENDAGTGFVSPGNGWVQISQNSSNISNSQCTVDVRGAAVDANGQTAWGDGHIFLYVGITFTPSFAGTKSTWINLLSSNPYTHQNIPWTNIGSVTVLAPANVTPIVGTPQSAELNTAFPSVLQVAVTDTNGVSIPNAAVTFTPSTSGASATFSGSSSPVTVMTNNSGLATAPTVSANGQGGSYTLPASVPAIGTPANFSLTNFGPAATVTANAGTPQSTTVGTAFATALQAIVKDAGGIPVSGTTVTFTAASSGASGLFAGSATATATTNGNGVATAPILTANTQAGSFSVTAKTTGVATAASFSLTNIAGAPTGIAAGSGTPQSTTTTAVFATPMQATVTDANGNPVSGISVTFSVLGNGAAATFSGGLTAVTTATNSSGVATAPTLTANSQVGSFTVTANTPGVSTSASFSLSNISGVTAPIFSPVAGAYGSAQTVTISTPTNAASIRYSTDGSTPSETAGTLYSGPVTVSGNTPLRALAFASGLADSAVSSATYTIAVAAPTLSPGTGAYTVTQNVTISTTTAGASIRYTTDGSTPSETAGTLYASPIAVNTNVTINAIAYKTGMADSSVASASYFFNWYNSSWIGRKSITIDHTQVSGSSNLTNFPILLSTTDSSLETVGNGGDVGRADGSDILFTASDGLTKLNHELEYYDPSSGRVIGWVQIPSLSPSANSLIYVYYGNASAANQQNAAGVWDSNYKGVWHLPNGTALTINDSTSNGNTGSVQGSVPAASGQVDGAASFSNNTANYIDMGANTKSEALASYTISAWVNGPTFTQNGLVQAALGRQNGNNNNREYMLFAWGNGTNAAFALERSNGSDGFPNAVSSYSYTNNAWYYLVGTYDGATLRMYVNGTADGTISTNSTIASSSTRHATIGRILGTGGNNYPFNGTIDEVRISNTNRSADWVKTEYNNQSAPSAFATLGAAQGLVAVPTFSPAAGNYILAQTVTISTTTPGASIRYTTDGTTPSETAGTLYSGPISVNTTTTLNAIAYAAGIADSSVASATYFVNWYNTAWTSRKSVTISHTKVSGSSTLTNYPMLFSVTDPSLKTVANGGNVGRSDGTDILFTVSDGQTKLNHELESYNPSTGQVIAWVQIPSLSPSTDTVIYVYYGNASAANQQNATGVWDSNYKGVWHLPNGTTLNASDSTANANNGTITGASATSGQIDGAMNTTASGQYITIGDTVSTEITGNITMEAWESGSLAGSGFILAKSDGSTYDYGLYRSTSQNKICYFPGGICTPTAIGSATHHVVIAVSGTTASFYIDGALSSTSTVTAPASTTQTLAIGRQGSASAYYFEPGTIDEVRISNTARSAAWVATEYNNQSSPSTFFTLGGP